MFFDEFISLSNTFLHIIFLHVYISLEPISDHKFPQLEHPCVVYHL